MKSKILITASIFSLAVLLSACSIKVGGGGNQPAGGATDGGIYKSLNSGDLWTQKSFIANASGKAVSFNNFDIYALTRDPADRNAIYASAIGEGLLYSYDNAETWQRVGMLGRVSVRSIAIDKEAHCTIYAAIDNKLYKSTDCTRSWNIMYTDNDARSTVNAVALDPSASKIVYLATSRGDILKSDDGAVSWSVIHRLNNMKIMRLLISPSNPRVIFAPTDTRGIFRSEDGGATWASLDKPLKDFKGSNVFQDMKFSQTASSTIFLANKYGLLKSDDFGDTWTKIELLTADASATIYALAVSPKDDKVIYYTTGSIFYRTGDGGATWTTKKLPSTRAGYVLEIDPVDPKTILMGMRAVQAR